MSHSLSYLSNIQHTPRITCVTRKTTSASAPVLFAGNKEKTNEFSLTIDWPNKRRELHCALYHLRFCHSI